MKTYILILISLFASFNMFAQSDSLKIDSLKKVLQTEKEDTTKVNTLNELSYKYIGNSNNGEKAISLANEALKLASTLNFKKGEVIAYYIKAEISDVFEERVKNADSSISLSKEIRDTFFMFLCYNIKAHAYLYKNNYPEGLNNYLIALRLAELSGDKEELAYENFAIADVYSQTGNFSEVLKSYQYSLKIYRGMGNYSMAAQCYNGIGQVYYKQNDYKTALYNFKEALTNDEKTEEKYYSCYGLIQIGKVYVMLADNDLQEGKPKDAKNNFAEAESNFNKAKILAESQKYSSGLPELYVSIGKLLIETQRVSQSKPYLDKALKLFQQNKDNDGIKEGYLGLSLYDSATGNFKKAYEDHKSYMKYSELIQNDSSVKKITQIKNQYEYAKKESFAKAIQDKKDTEAKRIKNQQYFVIAALGIVVLSVLIIAFIQWRNNKHKQKANLLLQQQKQKIESTLAELKSTQAQLIQSEKMASLGELTAGIAHEIQNPLNFVNNFSEVNKELLAEMKDEIDKGNIEEVKAIANDIEDNEQKIIHHGRRADAIVKGMLQHSRVSTGQKEPTDINALADEYLRLSYHGMRAKDKSFNAEIKTDFDSAIGKINVVPQDIGRVLLNLFNNAFYVVIEKKKQVGESYEPTISVSSKKLNDKVEIRVRDNGNGIPQKVVDKIFQPFFTTKPTGQGTGLGLSLSYDIIKAHGGEIRVESREGEGSEFIIQLSITAA
jgi:two-component system NtrC family sensor kinase